MSDKVKTLTIFFKKPVPEEYADKVTEALRLFDGVSKVSRGNVTHEYYFACDTVRNEYREKFMDILFPSHERVSK